MKEEVNNIFRKSYEQHESDVDPADIWQGIEAKRNQRKRPKFAVLFFTGFLLIGVAVLGYFLSREGAESSVSTLENTSNSGQVSNKDSNSESKNENQLIKSEVITEIETDREVVIKAEGLAEVNPVKESTTIEYTNTVSQSQAKTMVKLESENQISQTLQQVKVVKTNRAAPTLQGMQTTIQQKPAVLIQPEVVDRVKQKEVAFLDQSSSTKRVNEGITLDQLSLMPIRPFLLTQESSIELKAMRIEPKKFSLRDGIVTIDMIGGVGLFSNSYSSGDADYDQIRADSESSLESLHAGTLCGYQLHKVGIRTGITYTRFSSKATHMNQYFGTEDQEIISPYNTDAFNPELVNLSSDQSIILYSEMQVRYNKIETYSIPLLLNYRFTMGKLYVEPSIGLNFHIHQVVEQSVVSPDGELVKLDRNDIAINSDKVAGVSLYYPISPSLQLGMQVQGMHRKTQGIYNDRSTVGCNLGLGVRYIGF